jgi:hypothetical protein
VVGDDDAGRLLADVPPDGLDGAAAVSVADEDPAGLEGEPSVELEVQPAISPTASTQLAALALPIEQG